MRFLTELCETKRKRPLLLCLGVLVFYLALPTKNYYWDGIGFAQAVEEAEGLESSLLDPNHLLYRSFGYLLYLSVDKLGLGFRSQEVLRIANSLLSVACAYLFFHILLTVLGSRYLSGALTLLFSFSATWWKFSTDANAYIPSIFFLLLSFYFLLPSQKCRPVVVAVTHSLAICFHQLALFFYPVALAGIFFQTHSRPAKERYRLATWYSVVAFTATFCTFYYAFFATHGSWDFKRFWGWITTHAADASFSYDLLDNLFLSLRGHLRLFLGGRLSLFVETLSVFSILTAVLLAGLLVMLGWKLRGTWRELKASRRALRNESFRPWLWQGAVWVGTYVVFLFFWLPHNTFYRLFYLPALLLLAGVFLRQANQHTNGKRRYRLALLALAVVLFNLTFYIFPYSRANANPPVAFALQMNKTWGKQTWVFYAGYNSDTALVRYFNPETHWRRISPGELIGLEEELKEIYARGGTAWLETAAIDLLRSHDAAAREWLSHHTSGQSKSELRTNKYQIRFWQVLPGKAGRGRTTQKSGPN